MAAFVTTMTYIGFGVLFFFCTGICSAHTADAKGNLTPVILIPGHGGNQMNMKVERKEPILPGCPTSTNGWVHGWLNLWYLIPGNLECWVNHYKMVFDEKKGTYENVDGVYVEVPGWGRLDSVDYLDPSITAYLLGNVGSYFAPLIHKLEEWGYERGVNMKGAPYDFRYSPISMPNFYIPLQKLVEDTYEQNANARVSLISHSMGGLLTHYFLQKQSSDWKKKYIHSMVTMSTPWRGTVSMAEAVLSGYTWGFSGLQPNTFRVLQQTCESGVFLLPSVKEWGSHEVIVQTDNRNYTSSDYLDLLTDANFHTPRSMWEKIRSEIVPVDNPGVDTFCFFGTGKKTPESLIYEGDSFPDGPPHRVMGDGDGTSNVHSASACEQWKTTIDNVVVTKRFDDTQHNQILSSEKLFNELETILFG